MIFKLKHRIRALWLASVIAFLASISVAGASQADVTDPPAGKSASISFYFVETTLEGELNTIGKGESCSDDSFKRLRYKNATGSFCTGGKYVCVKKKAVLGETRIYSARVGDDNSLTFTLWGGGGQRKIAKYGSRQ